jgi:O-antigen/teichoic acid export membrane protein
MTRLLVPKIFGIMAIASTIQVIASLLGDVGLRQAIIQSPNGEDRSFLNTAWTLQVLRGCVIWGVCVCIAVGLQIANMRGWVPLGSVYTDPELPAVIAATSFTAVITGFQSTKFILVNRHLDLGRATLIELVAGALGLFTSMWLGWITRSIWAFVIGGLIAAIALTLLSHVWLHGPSDRLEWNRKALNELVHFGKWVLASSVVAAIAINGDRLLLGGWADSTVIGFYSIAFTLATVFEAFAGRMFASVSLPALSEAARDDHRRCVAIYFRMRWASDAVFVMMAGFLLAAGQRIIDLMYDLRYAPAGAMLEWLSFGLLFSRYVLTQNAYLALGRPDYLTSINIVRVLSLFILVPGLYYAFGIPGAIAGIAFQQAPTLPWIFWFNRRHGLNNFRMELAVLGMWPLGWLVGAVFARLPLP